MNKLNNKYRYISVFSIILKDDYCKQVSVLLIVTDKPLSNNEYKKMAMEKYGLFGLLSIDFIYRYKMEINNNFVLMARNFERLVTKYAYVTESAPYLTTQASLFWSYLSTHDQINKPIFFKLYSKIIID